MGLEPGEVDDGWPAGRKKVDKQQAPSNKRQATSHKLQASSNKHLTNQDYKII